MTAALDAALIAAFRAWFDDAIASAAPVVPVPAPAPVSRLLRGSWVWDYPSGVGNPAWESAVLAACAATGFTDLYCYCFAATVADPTIAAKMASFNVRAASAGVRVWGLEGDRSYFNDGQGPAQLFASIQAIQRFNSTASPAGKFYGFMIDMEPADSPSLVKFHNGISSPRLTLAQAADRQAIMADWLVIHQICQGMANSAGMKFASCLPSWCYDYFGAPVTCSFNGVTRNVWLHVMPLVDSGVIMSYATTSNGINAKIASQMANGTFPSKVSFAVETVAGEGSGVSYGDTVGKQSKAKVLADIATVENQCVIRNPNYGGWNIHSMAGWEALPA